VGGKISSETNITRSGGRFWRLVDHGTYFLKNAPWTVVTTFVTGLSTYAIMLLLMRFEGLEAVGQFRLLLSIVTMLSLATLLDTGKILIKYVVQEASGVVRPLMVNRMRWSLLGVVAGLVVAGVMHSRGEPLAVAVLAASLLLPLTYPTNLFAQIHQARRLFRFNALINIAKHAVLVSMVLVGLLADWSVIGLFIAYFAVLTIFNVWYMSWHAEELRSVSPESKKAVREATVLSGSGLLPVVLDNMDKFLVSYFLGLEALGIYAIGVSTGRLLLNLVKPMLVVYLADLVKKRLSRKFEILSFVLLTLVGLVAALALKYVMELFFKPDEVQAYPISFVILAGLGVYFVGVTKYYSAIYHKDSSLKVPVITNFVSAPIVVGYLLLSLNLGGDYALILCAGSYPLREALNIVVISVLSKWYQVVQVEGEDAQGSGGA
jgi:O-antigen/teichoic acid export membrane protein